jgi:hypothetical protein
MNREQTKEDITLIKVSGSVHSRASDIPIVSPWRIKKEETLLVWQTILDFYVRSTPPGDFMKFVISLFGRKNIWAYILQKCDFWFPYVAYITRSVFLETSYFLKISVN